MTVESQAVVIRDYTPELKASFKQLNVEWIERYFRVEEEDLKALDDPQRTILDPGGHIFFAECGREIIGTVALLKRSEDTFELAKMAVTPRAQGKKVGKRLMQAALAWAKAAGASSIYLETNDCLTPAVHLYRSAGFQEVPCQADSKYERCNLAMTRSL